MSQGSEAEKPATEAETAYVRIATLESVLEVEKQKSKSLQDAFNTLRSDVIQQQAVSEQEDEYRVNKLSKHLDQIKKEKQDLLMQVEQEEEYITNTLVKKLEQIRREKIDLENQLEQEEEFITNKLQKQLFAVLNDKSKLEKKLESETSDHERLAKLEVEISVLRNKMADLENERQDYEKKNDGMKDQLLKLKTENFALAQRIKREQERFVQVNEDKLRLMSNLEMGDEKRYNTRITVRARSVSLPADPRLPVSKISGINPKGQKSSPGKPGSIAPASPPMHARSPPAHLPHTAMSKTMHGHELIATPVRVRDPNAPHRVVSGTGAGATRSFAALRDMGARTFLQLWRLETAVANHAPDLAYDLSSISSYALDKNDPRCLTLSLSPSHSPHAPSAPSTKGPVSATLPTSPPISTSDSRSIHNIEALTLTFDKDEQAAEWFALLNELSV